MRLLIYTQVVDKSDPVLGFFHRWIEEFAKHFEHVDVVCLKLGEHSLPKNVSVFSLGKETGESRLKYVFRFYKYSIAILLLERVDFVLFHMGAVYNILTAPFFFLRKLTKTKFFWWKTHGKMNHLKERVALKFCDAVFTAGSKSFGLKTEKLRVVGHAIDINLFNSPEDTSVRDSNLCVVVGRIVPIKRIEVAIAAMESVQKAVPEMKLAIVGNSDLDIYRKGLEEQIANRRLNGIEFMPACAQDEIVHLYHEANILLHPAYEAGFDKVVLEAMATGVIPLTSIPSFESILGPFGLYLNEDDIEGYARRIVEVSTMDEEERRKLSGELRHIVVSGHSITTLPERIFGVKMSNND